MPTLPVNMPSGIPYALPRSTPLAARRISLLDWARSLSFVVWMMTLQLPFWFIRNWDFWQTSGFEFRTYYYVGFAVALAAHLITTPATWIRAPFQLASNWTGALITAFCAVCLLTAPMAVKTTTSAIYAVSTWAVFVLLFVFWQTDYRVTRKVIVLTGFFILAWQVVLMRKLGVHMGLSIGGIQRNLTGQAAISAGMFCMLSPRKIFGWVGMAAALFFCLLVNSRGSIVAMGAFLAAYYALSLGTVRAMIYGLICALLAVSITLAVPKIRNKVEEDVFKVHDEVRGIGSGMTGRAKLNASSSEFWHKPIFGFGLRSSQYDSKISSLHSGYLKIFVETGFVGGFLILGAVLAEAVRRFFVVQRVLHAPPGSLSHLDIGETIRLNSHAFATIFMTLILWIFEPVYVNLGAVSSVLFWMMLVAPTYVTNQGTAIQR